MEFKKLADNVLRDGSIDGVFNVMRSAIDIAKFKYPDEFLMRRSNLVNILMAKIDDDPKKVVREEEIETIPQRKIFKIESKKKIEDREDPHGNPKSSVTNQEKANESVEEITKTTPRLNCLKIKLKIKKKNKEGKTSLGTPKLITNKIDEEKRIKENEFKVEAAMTTFEVLKRKFELGQLQVKHARRKVRVNLGCGRRARSSIR